MNSITHVTLAPYFSKVNTSFYIQLQISNKDF